MAQSLKQTASETIATLLNHRLALANQTGLRVIAVQSPDELEDTECARAYVTVDDYEPLNTVGNVPQIPATLQMRVELTSRAMDEDQTTDGPAQHAIWWYEIQQALSWMRTMSAFQYGELTVLGKLEFGEADYEEDPETDERIDTQEFTLGAKIRETHDPQRKLYLTSAATVAWWTGDTNASVFDTGATDAGDFDTGA